jgi:predicted nuclease of predicted toxin-antitoxin system
LSIRFQADNDLKFAIVKAVRRREPAIDFASAHEAGLEGVGDPEILERADRDNRVLVSHDRRTMLNHFRKHLVDEKPSLGLLVVSQGTPIGLVVEAIILLWTVTDPTELRDQAYHLPSLIHHTFPR